jgi:hypothetical protein
MRAFEMRTSHIAAGRAVSLLTTTRERVHVGHGALKFTLAAGSARLLDHAQEVFVQRAGVCRDFAHLGITSSV